MQRREWASLFVILIAMTLLGITVFASRATNAAAPRAEASTTAPGPQATPPILRDSPNGGCQPLVYTSTNVPLAIPDNNAAGITSTLVISNAPTTISNVDVTGIVISHENASDLHAYLTSPEGTRIELWLSVCQASGNRWTVGTTSFTLSDYAATTIGAVCPPGQGTYHPSGALTPLTGDNPNGTWSLNISDVGALDVGTLYGWGINLTTVPCAGTPTSTPSPTPTNTPTRTPTNTPTNTPIPGVTNTFTPTPTRTQTATSTTTSTPTRTPSPVPTCGQVNIQSSDVPRPIPALSTVTSTLVITNGPTIGSVEVTGINLAHSDPGDLHVYLISAENTRIELFVGVCGGNPWTGANTGFTLSDNGFSAIGSSCPPGQAIYRPSGTLAPLAGEQSSGTWTLEIDDTGSPDSGTLNGWGLRINGSYCASPTPITPTLTPTITLTRTPTLTPTRTQTATATFTLTPVPCGQVNVQSNDVPKPIPALSTITSTLVISNGPTIASVEVTGINITHTDPGDLHVYLISAENSRIELFVGVCGGRAWTASTTGFTLSDNGLTDIGSTCPPGGGVYRPSGSLAPLAGEHSTGTWTLEIDDAGSPDSGTLNGWGLHITGVNCPTATPLPTATSTLTPGTPSPTGTRTPSATRTAGPSATITRTPSPAPTCQVVNAPSTDVPKAVQPGTTVLSTLVIANGPTIGSVEVTGFNIAHGDPGDLRAYLTSPENTRIELFVGACSGNPWTAGNTGFTLSDSAGSEIGATCPPGQGVYRPSGRLVPLAGEHSTGTWTLEIQDVGSGASGTLNGWGLHISAASCPPVTPCPVQFVDVPATNTFYAVVRCLACRGIVGGYPCGGPGEPCPGNYYRPNNNVTRGQVSKIVSESAGFHDVVPSSQQTFEDVPPGSTFALWVERLSGRAIINGYACGGPFEPCISPNNRPYFRPNNNVTRGQLSKITSGAAGWTETPTGQTFADAPPGSTFYLYIERVASRGIVNGYPCGGAFEPCVPPGNRPYFRPNSDATRGQMAKIAANAFYPNCSTPQQR